MRKIIFCMTVLITLASTTAAQSAPFVSVAEITGTNRQAGLAESVKTEIAKLGTGPDARIELKLHNGTRVKGYISEAQATEFKVVDSKTGAATTVPYPQVRKVKGNNLAQGVKIVIGVGVAILVLVAFCQLHGCEN